MSVKDSTDRVYVPVDSILNDSHGTSERIHGVHSSCCCRCRSWGVYNWLPLLNTVILLLVIAGLVIYHVMGGGSAACQSAAPCPAQSIAVNYEEQKGAVYPGVKIISHEETLIDPPAVTLTDMPSDATATSESDYTPSELETSQELVTSQGLSTSLVFSSTPESPESEEDGSVRRGRAEGRQSSRRGGGGEGKKGRRRGQNKDDNVDSGAGRNNKVDRGDGRNSKVDSGAGRNSKVDNGAEDNNNQLRLKLDYVCQEKSYGMEEHNHMICKSDIGPGEDTFKVVSDLHLDENLGVKKVLCCSINVTLVKGGKGR